MATEESIQQDELEQMFMALSFQKQIALLATELLCYRIENTYFLARNHQSANWMYYGDKDEVWKNCVEANLSDALTSRYLYNSLRSDNKEKSAAAFELKEKLENWFEKKFQKCLPFVEVCDLPDPSAAREDAAEDDGSKPKKLYRLPSSCIAFADGVWDFARDKWLFRYDAWSIPELSSRFLDYGPVDPQTAEELGLEKECARRNPFIVMWCYKNSNFKPMFDSSVFEMEPQAFYDMLRERDKEKPNLCFELVSNMSHDVNQQFDIGKFEHMCEIMGYAADSQRIQKFIMLVGSGSNGKDALFSNCFGSQITPQPMALNLKQIERGKFLGGLEKTQHNFCLEGEGNKAYSIDKLKELTGGGVVTLDDKYVRYHSVPGLNVKFIFATNSVDNLGINDNSNGFLRRKNFFMCYYEYDTSHKFMSLNPDYYPADLGDQCQNIKNNPECISMFCYLAMYGICRATNGFRSLGWDFCEDDWNVEKFSGGDADVQEAFESFEWDAFAETAERIEAVIANPKTPKEVREKGERLLRYFFVGIPVKGSFQCVTQWASYAQFSKEKGAKGEKPLLSEYLRYSKERSENSPRSLFADEIVNWHHKMLWVNAKVLEWAAIESVPLDLGLNQRGGGRLISKLKRTFPNLYTQLIQGRNYICFMTSGEPSWYIKCGGR